MLRETKSTHECWTERDGTPALTRSVFPDDALALIYKPARSAMTSGKARTRDWKLCFEPRSRPFIEPLMGWTGGDDTLSQVELTFPSAAAAVAYARRQKLHYILLDADLQDADLQDVDLQDVDNSGAQPGGKRECRHCEFVFVKHTAVGSLASETGMGRADVRVRAFRPSRSRHAALPRVTRVPIL